MRRGPPPAEARPAPLAGCRDQTDVTDQIVVQEYTVGALPKKRTSHRRQGNRRAHHKLKIPQLVTCRQCGRARLSHHACPNCGTYRGRQVLDVAPKTPSAE
jgi:large subunit ribosomal protein L32